MEIWKKIEGFENYEISNLGRVKSLSNFTDGKNVKEKILNPYKNRYGYCVVGLTNNKKSSNFLVHRLIALTFISNFYNKPCVNHINGIKSDNRVDNLEWNTYSENNNHAIKTGLKNDSGVDNYRSKLTNEKVQYIRDSNLKQKELALMFNMNQGSISNIKAYKRYKGGK